MAETKECSGLDDPRYRITMGQQMAASCTGALITSFIVTPFDVVKIRMQTQQKKISSNKCFLYCNGLMDHLCPCVNGLNGSTGQMGNVSSPSTAWYRRQGHFTGTVVSVSVDFTVTLVSVSVDFTVTLVSVSIDFTVTLMSVSVDFTVTLLSISIDFTVTLLSVSIDFTVTLMSVSVDFTVTLVSISIDFTVTLLSISIDFTVTLMSVSVDFTVTLDAFVKISRTEGVSSLWSGLSPTLVLAVPATMVYFVSYENLRLYIKDSCGGKQPFWAPMVAGATARSVSVSLVSPLELVRTKMQSKRISYLEIGEALKTLLHYHGVGGLFKGLGSTLLRDVPFSAIYWFNYEGIKSKFSTGVPSFGFSFMAGAVSGSVSSVLYLI
uniref:Solute carrier family 25 member 40 n=1 Tax=Timema monikensis TaxID=170555 RepID=A0A7R9EFH3_9NEOP|nr:unnamed protein product [Timema monikensis]